MAVDLAFVPRFTDGSSFSVFIIPTSLCSPSRLSLLRITKSKRSKRVKSFSEAANGGTRKQRVRREIRDAPAPDVTDARSGPNRLAPRLPKRRYGFPSLAATVQGRARVGEAP
jgi:hypothetical protein